MLCRTFLNRAANVLPSTVHRRTAPLRQNATSPIVRTDTDAYKRTAQELTLISSDEFSRRLHRFSRTNFDPALTDAAHAHVSELIHHRLQEVSAKCAREYAHLAHVARLHELCLDVYYARTRYDVTASSSSAAAAASAAFTMSSASKEVDVVSFGVSDFMVDSAYALGRPADLARLASYCRRHLHHAPLPGREVYSSFSLIRAFWRCVCLTVGANRRSAGSDAEAIRCAEMIYDESVAVICPEAHKQLPVRELLQVTRRFVQYASCGDEGEMLFFHYCLQHGLLRRPRDLAKTRKGETAVEFNTNESGGNDVLPGNLQEEQLFYATLIATCRTGHHVDAALRYFDDIGAFLGLERVSCGDLLRPRTRHIHPDSDDKSNMSESKSASLLSSLHILKVGEDAVDGLSEFLLFQLLNVLQSAKANDKIVYTARAIRRDGARLSIGVWSIVLISAGETRAADLALAAYAQARNALISNDEKDRRGNEYLLQTALHALSKCQVPHFEEDYLRPCHEQQLMHCTNEFYFCTLLQNAHNSTDPAVGAANVLQTMKEQGTPLTARIVSRLMKIYLRVESPKLLELYQLATQQLGLFKASWLDELLLWADRRRYMLTHAERGFVMGEVRRVHGADGAESDLGGLRTQYALLRYDYEHTPREVFANTGQPPTTEPTIMDSRVHFLIKKPHCLTHRTMQDVGSGHGGVMETALVGDPARKRRLARSALLTGEGVSAPGEEIRAEEFRVYMADMLKGLQRTNNYAD